MASIGLTTGGIMLKFVVLGLLAATLTGCVEKISDKEFFRQIAMITRDSPPTEVVKERYPPIDPKEVQVVFGFPDHCKNHHDTGLLTGWGSKEQSNQEIMQDFRRRAAKYGANMVVYEAGVTSVAEIDQLLRRFTEYTLYRCND